jgi:flagellar basal-body rod modification protein FlgD
VGKEDFLKLLVAQLRSQDPLSPLQGSEFVAQLAQFSSLEQLVNLSDRVAALALAQTAAVLAQAVSFVGKTVTARGGAFRYEGTGEVTLHVDLAGDAATATLTVVDATGRPVASREIGPLGKGRRSIAFDGRDKEGNLLPAGTYTFRVDAKDAAGAPVDATTLIRGVVEAVLFTGGSPALRVGGRDLAFGDVMEVSP